MTIMRPNIIDVEASGFGAKSYPIEIGFVMGSGKRYSTLIKPHEGWDYWDENAEKIHRIPRELLIRRGKSIKEVATQLNEMLSESTVYSDGWVVDKPWVSKLFYTARIPQRFFLSPLELILNESQMAVWHTVKQRVIHQIQRERHRASIDAFIIQETYFQSRNQKILP